MLSRLPQISMKDSKVSPSLHGMHFVRMIFGRNQMCLGIVYLLFSEIPRLVYTTLIFCRLRYLRVTPAPKLPGLRSSFRLLEFITLPKKNPHFVTLPAHFFFHFWNPIQIKNKTYVRLYRKTTGTIENVFFYYFN